MNVINNLLSVPGWRTKCFLTRRFNLPTKARLHSPLSKSVLSIIHEICLQFFSPTLHTTQCISAASRSFRAYVLAGLARLFPRGRLHQWPGRWCRRFVSFQCSQGCRRQTGCIKPAYEPSVQAASGCGRGGRRLHVLAPPIINRYALVVKG